MRRLPKHNSSAGSGLLFLLGQRPEISFGRARDPGRSYCTTDLPRRLLKTCPEKLLNCFLGRKWRWENEEAPGTALSLGGDSGDRGGIKIRRGRLGCSKCIEVTGLPYGDRKLHSCPIQYTKANSERVKVIKVWAYKVEF